MSYCQAAEKQVKAGKNKSDSQRWKCQECGRRYTPEPKEQGYPDSLRQQAAKLHVDGLDYKTVNDIVGDLIDIVSKNGTLLLNIGPRPDGTIPEGDQEILQGIGEWLAINGEAIYNTRPWHTFGEGPTQVLEGHFTDTKRSAFTGEDIRFTVKDNALYAIALAWPGETIHIISSDMAQFGIEVS